MQEGDAAAQAGAAGAWGALFGSQQQQGDASSHGLPYAMLKICVALPEGQPVPSWLQVWARELEGGKIRPCRQLFCSSGVGVLGVRARAHGGGGGMAGAQPWPDWTRSSPCPPIDSRWLCHSRARAQALMRSTTLIEVEDWSKFVHGCAALMPETVRAVPYWIDDPLIELSTAAIREHLEVEIAKQVRSGFPAAAQQAAAALQLRHDCPARCPPSRCREGCCSMCWRHPSCSQLPTPPFPFVILNPTACRPLLQESESMDTAAGTIPGTSGGGLHASGSQPRLNEATSVPQRAVWSDSGAGLAGSVAPGGCLWARGRSPGGGGGQHRCFSVAQSLSSHPHPSCRALQPVPPPRPPLPLPPPPGPAWHPASRQLCAAAWAWARAGTGPPRACCLRPAAAGS